MSDAPQSSEPAPSSTEAHVVHHRVHLLGVDGKPGKTLTLPAAFSEAIRPDLIRRAVVAAQSRRRQPHGTTPTAGRRHSVEWSGKGKGVARTPRLMDSNRGAQSPNTVGGAPAHPPRTATLWAKAINDRERRRAFRSALAATRELTLVRQRGHSVPDDSHLPFVVDTPLEGIGSTAEARTLLEKLHLWGDVDRANDGRHQRAGRGKRRGRRRRQPRSLLVVTAEPDKALGFRNLPGVDVVAVGRLGTEDLAPGGDPGRLTIFSQAALDRIAGRTGEAA